ncbi:MAG: molybdopterin-biosynthesis enzyme MoeA-like protein [Janthinobacterium sp.]|jgi:molybdopterin-biosynthesis enzyme MoeA-like protein
MIDLYCYYRVPEANTAAMQTLVAALHADLLARLGIAAQLKRRPGYSADCASAQQTWMEVYPAVPDDFEAVLEHLMQQTVQQSVQKTGLAAQLSSTFGAMFATLAASARHTEIFTDVAPCA